MQFRTVNEPRFWHITLCSFIWKSITVVFVERKHNIGFHPEIYTKNNAYKPKINIQTSIEILSSPLLQVGDIQRLVRPCSLIRITFYRTTLKYAYNIVPYYMIQYCITLYITMICLDTELHHIIYYFVILIYLYLLICVHKWIYRIAKRLNLCEHFNDFTMITAHAYHMLITWQLHYCKH